ncbi:MAG: hypothetical protein ACTINV_11975 [Cellulosimicrobium funkei]
MSTTPERRTPDDEDLVERVRAAQTAVEVPPTLDPDALAHRAVRRVRARRRVVAASGSAVAVAALVAVAAILPGALSRGSAPAPALAAAPARTTAPASEGPAPAPAAPPQEPARYLPVGDGELPALPGVEHGVVGTHHGDYTVQGGLTYTLPPGVWEVEGEAFGEPASVRWKGPEHWALQGSEIPADAVPPPMVDSGATVSIDVDPGAASWVVPARDSGAWTVEVPGSDFVVVTRGPSDDPDLARWEARVRYGGTGWTIRLDFTDDAVGDELARNFLGNLWFEAEGAPEWFSPTYTYPEIGPLTTGTPAGWQTATTGTLSYAVPPGWTVADVEGNYGPGVEWTGPFATNPGPIRDGSSPDVHWNMFVQRGGSGARAFDYSGEEWHGQRIEVPGADFAELLLSQGPFWADDGMSELSADVRVHGADGGENLMLMISLPGDDAGLETLRGILGSLRF